MFAREGYPFILGAAALAAITFAMALRLRSWPLWLVAIVLTIIALSVAWFFRNPTRIGERGANVAIAQRIPIGTTVNLLFPPEAKLRVTFGHRTVTGQTVIADVPVS